jgi:hypothetical protein
MTSTSPQGSARVPPPDATRIVPLHLPAELVRPLEAAAAVGTPLLTYRGGPLLAAVKVVTLYWGDAWSADLVDLAARVDTFFDDILSSELMDQLAEYGVPGMPIGRGTRIGRAVVTDPAPAIVVDDAAIRALLTGVLADPASEVPTPDPDTLYVVYTPPGTTVAMGGSRSCQAFCGYHDAIDGRVFYAVMPYPGCQGCTGGLDLFAALTSISSHELCEAVTDPVPGSGWYDDLHGEIGDICAWQTRQVGGYTVQLEWSNAAGACR